jgi:hypothetical protein
MEEKKAHCLNKIYGAILCSLAKKPRTLRELTDYIYGNRTETKGTRITCSICGNTKFYPEKKYGKISRYSKCKKCGKINWKNLKNKREENFIGSIVKDKYKDKNNQTNLKQKYLKKLEDVGLVVETDGILDLNYKAILPLIWELFISESLVVYEGENKDDAITEHVDGYAKRLQKGKNYHKTLKRLVQKLANRIMPVGYLEAGFDAFLKDFLIRGLALIQEKQFIRYIQRYSRVDALTKEDERILREFFIISHLELQSLDKTMKEVIESKV